MIDQKAEDSLVWTSERIVQLMQQIEDGKQPKVTPFWEGRPEWRSGNIVFEYTVVEQDEIQRCATDVIYFANNYCFAMTDDGVQKITLRDYQEDVLRDMQENRFVVFKSARQIGKTVVTGIFLVWYLLFHVDKNLMVLANVGSTTVEIIDKVKVILSNLPFFMKPGIIKNDVQTMKFDNGCRLFGRNTTKTAAIGFTVHFLYCDEFAHIHNNFLDPFWRSVYPTLSSSKISRCVITSTPNGQNKFYDIFKDAIEKQNEFKAIQVDWWQVPGRDEAWMRREIANLGSIEDFNQEYGGQFLKADKLLLDARTLEGIKAVEYRSLDIEELDDLGIQYTDLRWHPKFSFDNMKDTDRFVMVIDTAGGGGGDYSVVNIFKLVPMQLQAIEKTVTFSDESDFFSMLQIGIFRSNKIQVEDLVPIIEVLLYKVFGSDKAKIVLEMDFKGNVVWERMLRHNGFYEDIFVHTKHAENSLRKKPGIKLNPKNKLEYCLDMRRLIKNGRIIPTEKVTYTELLAFGINKRGSYSSQIGHDDCAMTIVNATTFFKSDQFYEFMGDIYDTLDERYKEAITKKLNMGSGNDGETGMDMDFLKSMMDE